MAMQDDCRIISTSKPMHKASIPIPDADHSTDQPDSVTVAGDQEDVYVKVTILAKKVMGTTGPENTTIQLKQLLVSLISLFLRAHD